jgi:dTDP-4-dehydrorhamnose 3,5-epimerase
MRFVPTELPGVVVVEPRVHRDARGFFVETYHEPRYREHGIALPFVQDNHSLSRRGTLRGLHGQSPRPQGKLVRVIEGEIWDVAVDVRLGSPGFARHAAVVLSAENFRQVYVPPGVLHGFCVLSEVAQVEYKCTEVYDPQADFSVRWNDPELAVPWPISDPLLSEKDARAPFLRELRDRLIPYEASPAGENLKI